MIVLLGWESCCPGYADKPRIFHCHIDNDLNTMTTDILNIIDFSNSYSRYWNFNVASSFVRKTYHIIYSRYDEGDYLLELYYVIDIQVQ